MTTTTQTTCPYCGVGCGVTATLDGDNAVSIAGDGQHPSNKGSLCSKGTGLSCFCRSGRLDFLPIVAVVDPRPRIRRTRDN